MTIGKYTTLISKQLCTTQHNTTQFACLTFNNHSTIFQGQLYGVTITKTKDTDFSGKINVLG